MADEFYQKMPDFHVTFRDLLHAVNPRHVTDGFTSLPKEGVLRIFFRSEKSDGFGRVWTRELGYQRPARYLQTTEAAWGRPLPLPSHFTTHNLQFTLSSIPIRFSFWHSVPPPPGNLHQALELCDSYFHLHLIQNWLLWLVLLSSSSSILPSNATGLSFFISNLSCLLKKRLSLQKCTQEHTWTHWHSRSKEEFSSFVNAFVDTA